MEMMGEGNLLQERKDENPGNFLASLAWCNAVYVGVCVCVCVCVIMSGATTHRFIL